MKDKFYIFRQNNSGGRLDVDGWLTHFVIVEAETEEDAITKGKDLGIYFNGCQSGMDCQCCGDRWDEPDLIEYEGDIILYAQNRANNSMGWCSPEVILHMKDGSVYKFFTQDV